MGRRVDRGMSGSPPYPWEAWRTRLKNKQEPWEGGLLEHMTRPGPKVRLGCFSLGHDALDTHPWLGVLFAEGADGLNTGPVPPPSCQVSVCFWPLQLKPGVCLPPRLPAS